MLYNIVNPKNDAVFRTHLNSVKKAYWPEEILKQNIGRELQELEDEIPSDYEKIKDEIEEIYKRVSYDTGREKLYIKVDYEGQKQENMYFPLLNRFHQFFLKRKWDQLSDKPISIIDDLTRLQKESGGNFSFNSGNFCHFVNVVAALARLIMHFKTPNSIRDILEYPHIDEACPREDEKNICLYKTIAYGKYPTMRSFKLMISAFYHDVGKTVVDPRHGVEGALILAFNTIPSRYILNSVSKAYNDKNSYDRDDYLFLCNMLIYHDQYGTLSTGEDSYLRLVDMIDQIKRYSLKMDESRENQIKWSQRYLFDLWLLNVADIIVSKAPMNKWILQKEWESKEKSKEKIQAFLKTSQFRNLQHDLKISFKILDIMNETKHSDNTSRIQEIAYNDSKRHAMERIRRLIASSLSSPLLKSDYKEYPKMTKIVDFLKIFSEDQNQSSILRSIQSIGETQEFCSRLGWIGKMDYGLGFFEKLAGKALDIVCREINGEMLRTGWIVDDNEFMISREANDQEFKLRSHAQYILSNYTAIMIQILSYLLFRQKTIDSVKNIQFCDTRERLDADDRIERILYLEGPFRSRRSTQLILENIFVY